ncbi:MAG: hypothetical protein DHS20C17_17320 [Cyclobacteriaceae bacterium]|nr:MAG: hypothetical protein DHS20C17_17320 [Cyclobacteriaceae bacterium]
MKKIVALLTLLSFVSLGTTFKVERVVDGDTFKLENGDRVRLIGINAPELDHDFGNASRLHLKKLIEGKIVDLQTDGRSSAKDKYGRLLRYVILEGEDINERMILDGYAYAFLRYDFEKSRLYKESQSISQEQGLGIWERNGMQPEFEAEDTRWTFGLISYVVLGLIILLLSVWIYRYERNF